MSVKQATVAAELSVQRRGGDMRKWRRLLFGVVVLLGLAGAAVVLWPSPQRPEPSLRTLTRLDPGMTEAQVAALLGPSAADVTGAPPPGVPPPAPGGRLLVYSGDRATATVEFGADGRVVRFHPDFRSFNLEERIRIRLNCWW
jgi:hypothetical protein